LNLNPFRKYICIKQHDEKDCGPACLATIAKQHGLKLPISKIREIAGTDKQGTNVYGLIKAAEKLGFTAKGVRSNQEAFFEKFPLPAIAHVIKDQRLLHYVVIHRIVKNEVIVADPAEGIVKYKPEEFFQIWTGVLVLMVPTPQFQKGDKTQGLFSRFFGMILPHKKLIIHVMLASILITLFGIAASFYFQFLIDEILPYGLTKTLHIISIGLIVMYLFQVLLTAFRTHLLLYISQKLSITIMLGYYRHVLQLPINFFGTRKTGEIISRFMDANKVTNAISSAALTVILDVVMILLVGGILYYQNSSLFFITLLLIPFYALVVWLFVKPYESINRSEME
jgi:ATP-binding cassette subfamily B protein